MSKKRLVLAGGIVLIALSVTAVVITLVLGPKKAISMVGDAADAIRETIYGDSRGND